MFKVTPLVLWGAGARTEVGRGKGFAGFPVLEGRAVPEVRQIDLAPLMATLLGVPVPRHNLGRCRAHTLAFLKKWPPSGYHST